MDCQATIPYLTPEEQKMLEMYRRCTPEMKAEIDKRLLLLAIGGEEDDATDDFREGNQKRI